MVDNWDFMSLLEINKDRTEELLLQFQFDFSDRDDTNLEKYLLKNQQFEVDNESILFLHKE